MKPQTEGSTGVEKTKEDILENNLNYSSTLFGPEVHSNYRLHALRAMQQYSDQQNAACLAALKECKSMLESVVRLKHILTYEENIPPEHEGEAIAINNMFYKIENILTRIDTVTSK